jgi:hypothetical protein
MLHIMYGRLVLLDSIIHWLTATDASRVIKQYFWVVPTVQSIHIISEAIVFSSSILLLLRAWGLIALDLSQSALARRLIPGLLGAAVMLVLTGSIMIVGEPSRVITNATFQRKMLAVAFVIPLFLYAAKLFGRADEMGEPRFLLRALTIVMTAILIFIICSGRWIAYT